MPTLAVHRLTPLQRGMVYHSLLSPRSGVYVQQLVVRLRERLDAIALREAWQQAVARHDALRSRFRIDEGMDAQQEVDSAADLAWIDHDLRALSPDAREARLQEHLDRDRTEGLDLARGPTSRVALIRLADEDQVLLWTYHHALLDGRSRSLLLTEILADHDARRRGDALVLPEPPAFADFVRWLGEQDRSASQAFWARTLSGITAPTPLPGDGAPREETPSKQGRSRCEHALDEAETSALTAFAAAHGVTLGTLVQAAWAALLARHGGGDDVVFGATRACRHAPVPGVASMIGLLINTVPFRVRVEADRPVAAWLAEVRAAWIALRAHEHDALQDIHAWSAIGPSTPLFESLLVFEDRPHDEGLPPAAAGGAPRELSLLERGDEPLVALAYGGKRLRLRLTGDRARFDDATLARLLASVRSLLLGMADDPLRCVGDLPLAPDAEQRALVEPSPFDRDPQAHEAPGCLHRLFEDQAARTPDAVAMFVEAERVTYGALDARANQLAHHLRAIGVAPEVRVALCLPRTPALLVAVLAILKAGGAYVPLDPDDAPELRAARIVESGASVLVTEGALAEMHISLEIKVISIDHDAPAIQARSLEAPVGGASPSSLAYALPTSGSTGEPKLIGVEHRSAVNAIRFTTRFLLTARDLAVSPFTHAIGFDPSVHQLFAPWSVGGAVVLLPSIFALAASVHAQALTYLGSAPSVLSALLQDAPLPASVRVVNLGAEAPTPDLLARLAACPHLVKVVNLYGPTEASIYCSHAVLLERDAAGEMVQRAGPRTIGRPIWNARMHLLDARGQLVPEGTVGEIHLGGACLARGYLDDPAQTAARFVPDPFAREAGARLYRTGDVGRRHADGSVGFVGRIDDQVKLHGLRIEPGGIEARLAEHPEVGECVVRAIELADRGLQLVAHVAARSGEVPEAAERAALEARLRAHLAQRLPRAQVPRVFVFLRALPRTSRGKIDLRALPAPSDEPRAAEAPSAPRSPVEEAVAQIWAAVLAREVPGVDDDFFELGGDSLTAMRVIGRLNQAFDADLDLRALFDAPTVAELARTLAEALQGAATPTSTG